MNQKKEKNNLSNVVLVNLVCLVIGLFISILLLEWGLFGLSLTLFVNSMINYAITSRANENYFVWDRIALICLITSFLALIFGFFDLVSNLH